MQSCIKSAEFCSKDYRDPSLQGFDIFGWLLLLDHFYPNLLALCILWVEKAPWLCYWACGFLGHNDGAHLFYESGFRPSETRLSGYQRVWWE
jgi:hypothetical protein